MLGWIQGAPARLVVLYGKRGIGKTELVLRWMLPNLARLGEARAAFYLDANRALAEQTGAGSVKSLWSSAKAYGMLFVDNAGRLLESAGAERKEFLGGAMLLAEDPDFHGKVVLIVDEDQLRGLFLLRGELPEILDHTLEIGGIDLRQGLSALLPGAESAVPIPDATPPGGPPATAIGVLAERRGGVSPELLRIVEAQLRRAGSGAQPPSDLDAVLWDHVRERLESIPAAGLAEKARFEAGFAILEQVVASGIASAFSLDLAETARRVGVAEEDCRRLLEHLEGAEPMIRELEGQRLVLVPSELTAVVAGETERRKAGSRDAEHLIDQALPAWQAIRSPLPQRAFREVQRHRRSLRLQGDEIELLLYSSLLWDLSPELRAAHYWLRRLASDNLAINVLASAFFHVSARVRGRAAALLGEISQSASREQLQTLALADSNPEVRQRALAGLAAMKDETLRQRLLSEAHAPSSQLRQRAIEALRIFDDPATAQALREMTGTPALPWPLRRAAIETLGTLRSAAAAGALIEIALAGDDGMERGQAATVLRDSRSAPLLQQALASLRARTSPAAEAAMVPAPQSARRLARRWSLAVLLAIVNWFVHGLVLLLQRRRLGLVLLGTEAAGAVLAFSGTSWRLAGVALLFGSFLLDVGIGQLVPLRSILDHRGRRTELAWGGIVGLVLWVASLPVFFCVHGLAHLVARRPWRQVAACFSLELSAILLYLAVPAIDPSAGTSSADRLTTWFWLLYAGLGLLLFLWSFAADVRVVPRQIVFGERIALEARRDALLEQLLANRLAVSALLAALDSDDPLEAGWASSMLSRHADAADAAALLSAVTEKATPRPEVVRALAHAKDDRTIESLAEAWETADAGTRKVIMEVLVRHPKEESLAALREVSSDLTLAQKVRCVAAAWHFRLRVWPKRTLAAILLALPLLGLLCYQSIELRINPVWPQLRVVANRLAPRDARQLAADYAARAQPDKSVRQLASVLADPEEDVELRATMVRPLSLIAADRTPSAIADQALGALASALATQMPVEVRQEVLFQIPRVLTASNTQVSAGWIGKLAAILGDVKEVPDLRRSALQDLAASRSPQAIAELRDFVALGKATAVPPASRIADASATESAQREQELRLDAIRELGRIGTLDAARALDTLAGLPLAPILQERVQEARADPLAGAYEDFHHRRFQEAIDKAKTFLSSEEAPLRPTPIVRAAWSLIGRSYYKLAKSEPPESNQATFWVQQAVVFLTKARAVAGARDSELDRTLAGAYLYSALPALLPDHQVSQARQGRSAGAEKSLLAAIDLAPDGPAGGLLMQLLHQRHEDARAAGLFRQLQLRFPHSSAIAAVFSVIESEYLSEADPRAYEDAYQALVRTFAENPAFRSIPTMRANLVEAELTSGRFREAARDARELLASPELSGAKEGAGAELNVNVRLLLYLALVFAGDPLAARSLDGFGQAYGRQSGEFVGWKFGGITRFIQHSSLPRRQRDSLLALVSVVAGRRSPADLQRALGDLQPAAPVSSEGESANQGSAVRSTG